MGCGAGRGGWAVARRGAARGTGDAGGAVLVARHVVLVLQLVPALDLLVLVFQTLVPVFQALSFGRDPQLAASWMVREGGDRRSERTRRAGISFWAQRSSWGKRPPSGDALPCLGIGSLWSVVTGCDRYWPLPPREPPAAPTAAPSHDVTVCFVRRPPNPRSPVETRLPLLLGTQHLSPELVSSPCSILPPRLCCSRVPCLDSLPAPSLITVLPHYLEGTRETGTFILDLQTG